MKKNYYSTGIFTLICLLFMSFELYKINHACWQGDYWEHLAVVKELISNSTSPQNPILNTNIPHAFFSPYSLLVAETGKLFNWNATQSLYLFSIFNLIFFILQLNSYLIFVCVNLDEKLNYYVIT